MFFTYSSSFWSRKRFWLEKLLYANHICNNVGEFLSYDHGNVIVRFSKSGKAKMNPELHENSLSGKLAERIAIVPLLFAVVLGSSLIRFHEILFPPKVCRLEFWAFCVVYLSAFASWFGWHEATYRYPYTRKPIARLRAGLEAMVALSWAALLFMASQAADSLHGYLWGFTVIFAIHSLVILVRRLEWRSLDAGYQPLRGTVIHGLLMAAASACYTAWVLAFAPIPSWVKWIFVFVPLLIVAIYRWPQMIRELPKSVTEE